MKFFQIERGKCVKVFHEIFFLSIYKEGDAFATLLINECTRIKRTYMSANGYI